jgi:hypothetical protein
MRIVTDNGKVIECSNNLSMKEKLALLIFIAEFLDSPNKKDSSLARRMNPKRDVH